jgi:hypothetical protein
MASDVILRTKPQLYHSSPIVLGLADHGVTAFGRLAVEGAARVARRNT